jgi:hypothetical protein
MTIESGLGDRCDGAGSSTKKKSKKGFVLGGYGNG